MREVHQSLLPVLLTCSSVGYWIVAVLLKKMGSIRGPKSSGKSNSGHNRGNTGFDGHRENPHMAEDFRSVECRCRDILGVAATAPAQEIKAAYRMQLSKYHPDKVAHLGGEFYVLATRRTKEIIEAYEYLCTAL